jgi:hypothetical protein
MNIPFYIHANSYMQDHLWPYGLRDKNLGFVKEIKNITLIIKIIKNYLKNKT